MKGEIVLNIDDKKLNKTFIDLKSKNNSHSFEELYKLLNTKFDGSTKLEINGKPVSELTVYAKWAIPDDEPGTGATFGPSEELEITPPSTGVIASKNIYTELLIIISVLGTASLFTVSRNKD